MVLAIKKRFFYYKRFEIDVWGLMKTNLDINPCIYADTSISFQYAPLVKYALWYNLYKRYKLPSVSKKISKICGLFWYFSDEKRLKSEAQFGRYIYRLDSFAIRAYRKRAKHSLMAMHLVRLFYLIHTSRQFKRLGQMAFKQSGSFFKNYLCLLEGRLCSVVYRAGFFSNLFDSLHFIKQGLVWVDNKYVMSMYFYIEPMQMLGFNPVAKGTILWNLLRRLNRKLVLSGRPKYMYISYNFLFFFWKRIPKGKELINPITVDMLRACNYDSFF